MPSLSTLRKTEYIKLMRFTTSSCPSMVTLSPISYGCLTKRKMQHARNSVTVPPMANDRPVTLAHNCVVLAAKALLKKVA